MARERKPKHTATQYFDHATSYSSEGPQGHIARHFFGIAKRCLCRACLDKQGKEDIKRLKAKGLVA